MTVKKKHNLKGFTLVELMSTMVIMVVSASAVGVVIVDSQNGWNKIYNQVNADVVTDGYVVKKKFDSIIRSASSSAITTDSENEEVTVYYYASGASASLDRYARFYTSDGDLMIEYGQLNPEETLDTETLCENVSSCKFYQTGCAVEMFLKLDDGTQTNVVVTSAFTNN